MQAITWFLGIMGASIRKESVCFLKNAFLINLVVCNMQCVQRPNKGIKSNYANTDYECSGNHIPYNFFRTIRNVAVNVIIIIVMGCKAYCSAWCKNPFIYVITVRTFCNRSIMYIEKVTFYCHNLFI